MWVPTCLKDKLENPFSLHPDILCVIFVLCRHQRIVNCCSRKHPFPSHRRFFGLNPPHPSGNFSLAPYFIFQSLALETSHHLGISIGLPWGGHGYFLELHNDYDDDNNNNNVITTMIMMIG